MSTILMCFPISFGIVAWYGTTCRAFLQPIILVVVWEIVWVSRPVPALEFIFAYILAAFILGESLLAGTY